MKTAQYTYSEAELALTAVLTRPQGATTTEVVAAYDAFYAAISKPIDSGTEITCGVLDCTVLQVGLMQGDNHEKPNLY